MFRILLFRLAWCVRAASVWNSIQGAQGSGGSCGWGGQCWLCPRALDEPASLSCARWEQPVEFRQQRSSCWLEWYLEIKAQITSGNTVIQKSPMLMEFYRNMLWLVLAGQCFGTLVSVCPNWLVQVTPTVEFKLCVICRGFCLLSLEL